MRIIFVIIFILLLITLLYQKLFYEDYECCDKPQKKIIGDYLKSCHSGLIRGAVIGLLIGTIPLEAAITNASVFGVTNPIIMYFGY